MNEPATRILENYLSVNEVKPISYLPSKTITDVLGMSLENYMKMAREKGLYCAAFSESESCINGGAVYVYDQQHLGALLLRHRKVLHENGWPSDTAGFIQRITSDWLNEEDPLLPVVRQAFGDLQQN